MTNFKKVHLPLRACLEHSPSPLFQGHWLTISSPWWSGTWGQSLQARAQRAPRKVVSLPVPASWNSFNQKREGSEMAEPKKLSAPGGFCQRIQILSSPDRNCSLMSPLKGRYFNHRAGLSQCHRVVPHRKEQDSREQHLFTSLQAVTDGKVLYKLPVYLYNCTGTGGLQYFQ